MAVSVKSSWTQVHVKKRFATKMMGLSGQLQTQVNNEFDLRVFSYLKEKGH
jgi:hypothetical protein